MNKYTYNPNQHYKLNGFTLTISVIGGLVAGMFMHSAVLMILLPVFSQYKWIKDALIRIVNKDDIEAISRLSNSAKLTDKADKHTLGRYRAAATYQIENHGVYKLIHIDANGVTSTKKLDSLANDIAAAFHRPAYLVKLENGIATYRVDMKGGTIKHANETDF